MDGRFTVVVFFRGWSLCWSSVATMRFGRPPLDDVIRASTFTQKSSYPARGAA